MGYVNEMVPEEEKKEYQMPNLEKKIPRKWTIDREKNMILLPYGLNIDDPYEKRFVLMKDEKIIMDAILEKEVVENTVTWNMRGFSIAKNCCMPSETVMEEFRKAMKVYGFKGLEVFLHFNAEVIINF